MAGCCCEEHNGQDVRACPICNLPGQSVDVLTVRSLVNETIEVAADEYYFCSNPRCANVYYNQALTKTFDKAVLNVRVGLKEIDGPITVCYCANITQQQIMTEILNNGARNLQDIQERTGAMTGGRCKYTNPTGKCCHEAVKATIAKALENLNLK